MTSRSRKGFTIVEIMIVVVIMAILAATIIPQFTDSTRDAKINTTTFNLQTLRGQIETYKAQHDGKAPTDLADLTKKTDKSGTVSASGEYGPYVNDIPMETIGGTDAVATSSDDPITVGATEETGGWIYNNSTGEIRVNHKDHSSL